MFLTRLMDAHVAYGFHHLRNTKPYLAQGPISNKIISSCFGCSKNAGTNNWSRSSSHLLQSETGTGEPFVEVIEDVGQQLALAFNQEGSVLATGAEDGTL